MIAPEEIREKADRLYPKAIVAWLTGEQDFFPRSIPANTETLKVHIEAIQEVQTPEAPEGLTSIEHQTFITVRDKNRRLEQEHIPQSYVNEKLK